MARDKVQVTLVLDAGDDAREREDLTSTLRRELLQLDVDAVERVSAGDAPPGSRAIDMAQIGTLLVTVGNTATGLTALITAVRSWLGTRGNGTVKMQIGGDTLEITGHLSEDQKAVVAMWIKAHAPR
jgi:Effector Associated Constant Component 1